MILFSIPLVGGKSFPMEVHFVHQHKAGSLTKPPCSETVQWLLMTTLIEVAEADVASFAKLYGMNARPPQKMNRLAAMRSG